MAEANEIGKVKIRARLSYEHLWRKSASIEGGPEKYRANFIIDPSTKQGKKDIAQIENAIDDVIDDVWGGKKPKFKEDRYCFQDGNDMVNGDGDVRDGYADMMFVKAANDKRPKLRDRNGQDELTEEDDKIYSGAEVVGYLRFYGMKDPKKGGNGIFCTVDGVQFYEHGEKFGGGGMSDDEFENYGDSEDEKPARTKRRSIDDDEDEKPARRSRSRDTDDDERPARRRSRDDDEDEKPARRSRSRDDDEDEKPARRSRPRDDDDEPVRPKRRSRDDDDI